MRRLYPLTGIVGAAFSCEHGIPLDRPCERCKADFAAERKLKARKG